MTTRARLNFWSMPKRRVVFHEVNPRIQVEHTVTEMVTALIWCAAKFCRSGPRAAPTAAVSSKQENVPLYGHALQCRITTEDPANNFLPDYGRITRTVLRQASVFASTAGPRTAAPSLRLSTIRLLVKVTRGE